MAHELDNSTGQYAFAAVGGAKSAWHNLGQEILPGDSLATIAKKAGLAWDVLQGKVSFRDHDGKVHEVSDSRMNYRADTMAPLGIVSASHYKIVQPSQVLEFFRDFLSDNKLSLETAGAVRGGRIIWGMAKLGKDYSFMLPGKDRVTGYLRLQTSFDGTRATDAVATTVRQVCANTMRMVDADAQANGYRVSHSTLFDAKALQSALGLLGEQHKMTAQLWNALVERKVTADERREFFANLFSLEPADLEAVNDKGRQDYPKIRKMIGDLEAAFANGPGAGLKSSKDTAFGLLQAVTYWVDHQSGARDVYGAGKDNARLTSAWFGLGERTKQDAQVLLADLAGVSELVAA